MLGGLVTIASALGCLGIACYVAYCYLTAPVVTTTNSLDPKDPAITRPSTTMDRLAFATKKSASLFKELATGFTLMLTHAVLNMSDFFGAPELRAWVTDHFSVEVGSTIIVGLIFLGVWARVRNAMGA